MKYLKHFENFSSESLYEYLDLTSVKNIVKSFSPSEIMIIRNVNSPIFLKYENDKLVNIKSEDFYKYDKYITNFKEYFTDYDVRRSEIIKFDFNQGLDYVVLFLCYTKNERFSVVTISYNFHDTNVLLKLNNYLQSKGFEIMKRDQESKLTTNFISNLVKIFKVMSSPYYKPSEFFVIKYKLSSFVSKNKELWQKYKNWKFKLLGSSVDCIRFINLNPDMKILLTNNNWKLYKELSPDDEFYYPIYNRNFSQWVQLPKDNRDIEKIKCDMGGICSYVDKGFLSKIPTNKIILAFSIFMYNFSPRVNEREVIVEHDIRYQWDKEIVCRLV